MINNKLKLLPLTLVTPLLLTACQPPAPATAVYSDTDTYFDTVISVTVYDSDDQPLIADCFELADHYEQLLSRTIETSDVSRINNANGEFVEVDDDTIELLTKGISYCDMSVGTFDVTVGTLSDLWDITNNPGIIPDEADIETALSTIDYQNVEIDGNLVRLTSEGTTLDLGAIAKGYIADQMKTYLEEKGVTSAMINLGGNVLTVGSKPDGKDFTVGIQKPFDETGTPMASVSITGKSVVTSGIYERYFELDGKIYHHILDTTTGYPIDNELTSVTIVSDQSVDGDALSTTCFALGVDKGLALLESLDEVEGMFVTSDGNVTTTSGMGTKISYQLLK